MPATLKVRASSILIPGHAILHWRQLPPARRALHLDIHPPLQATSMENMVARCDHPLA